MTTASSVSSAVTSMLRGDLTEKQIIEIFENMEQEPLTVEHLIAGALAMREAMVSISLAGDPIDTCGTGGSGLKTINTSTLVAFTVAATGVTVAKHGNRSASGNCGCFDALEGLGITIDLTPQQEVLIYNELGIVFLFAKTHHPAMRFVGPARKTYGKKTLFNLLGPLCNPASVARQVIGTGNLEDAKLMAGALKELGSTSGFVVTGDDGLDEVSICSNTIVHPVSGEDNYEFDPQTLSITLTPPSAIEGGTVEENVKIIRDIAAGEGVSAHQDLIALNSAFALLASGTVNDIKEGYERAHQTLQSREVLRLIDRYIEVSKNV